MKKFTQIAGLAGVIVLVLGAVVGLTQRHLSTVVLAHIIGGSALLLLGALANIPEIKEALMKRSTRMGPQVLVQAVLVIVILAFINWIALRHDLSRDMTRERLFTFSRATNDVVSNLPGDVAVIAFFPGGGPGDARQRLLLYQSDFPRVKLRFVDPDKHEEIARAEAVPPEVGVLFKYGKNRIWINKFAEQDITNAFIKVTRGKKPKVLFTSGHMEPGLESKDQNGLAGLTEMLKQQGYEPQQVDLQTLDKIPDDVSMIAIVGAVTAFSEQEIKVLDYFMGQGGNAIIFLDPVVEEAGLTGLERFILPYGIEADFNMIFDPKNHMARDRLGISLVIHDLLPHPITEGLTEPRVVFSLARSLKKSENLPESLFVDPLVRTSGDSYEKNINPLAVSRAPSQEEGARLLKEVMESPPEAHDRKGPFFLGYAVKKEYDVARWKERVGLDRSREMRLVVLGTSSVCRNTELGIPYNYELVMNAFNWLAGESDLKYIRSPERPGTRIYLDKKQKDRILYLSVLIVPEFFMIVGLAVWWRKR
jgi:hypothetical protein